MRRRLIWIVVFLVIFVSRGIAAQVDTLQIWSPSMDKTVMTVVISPDMAKTKQSKKGYRYPVLYLLHGYEGNAESWIKIQPRLPQMSQRDSMIVVCPDGRNHWYWDSPKEPKVRYETFLSKELPACIDSLYRTRADRMGRGVTGLSMGGHGGMWISMRHKDAFGAGGSTSGALDILPFPDHWQIEQALGNFVSDSLAWKQHSAISQIDRISNGDLALIIDCGYEDFVLGVNQAFHNKLMERGIGHDYLLRPGGHSVPYWNNAIDYQWIFFKKFFDRGKSGSSH